MTNFRIVATGKWIIFILAALVCGSINYFQNSDEYSDIAPQTGQYLTCKTDLQGNSDVFSVYVTDGRIAEMASERLCNDKTIKRQYGEVKVTIGQSDYDTFRYINHGVVDLALVKSNVVDAFGADQIYGLTKVASHPDYSAFFIALRERPLLSKEYLLGKKIGLLDYPSSRSGHIVPKTVLQNLGLSDSNLDIVYFSSHQELRRALLAGDIDIISSYWAEEDKDNFSRNYATPLQESVSGMQWYLKMQTQNTDLFCAIQSVIHEVAMSHPRPYYKTITLEEGCN
ncbi:PhnD/SsuA/transferrin family substrate-binding protein [Alteromonas sp. DY56-G5]|uniref:PhnD/SsuA/transferrin family substrate-binding protein n=1 Tax=Gammaproteobacteria TaxID=1236 RepID=UPI001CC29785|nr:MULTISPECIES: PhnD/SsuA/transferrin family substrate-binding protein [Gammaproteobacteria]MCG8496308.1 PhnD/SsuA/transferrin family substrate-binding protein [Enterobacterales bacterium]MEC8452284.1 PhnD/SsuA/transferrin family substrate-binding protein [Pseudomonadota bacterium]MCZ4241685.1 PhnD/SsuA/transferrin family substrate-binding protein [Alteromonas macleodii]MDM7962417.1 PhnD/SsuA/transferrin family substrate-binding protein [Alteromonas macleodii]MDM8170772.1 PhnD/SsuA/transferri